MGISVMDEVIRMMPALAWSSNITRTYIESLIHHHVRRESYENLLKLWNKLSAPWKSYTIGVLELDKKINGFIGFLRGSKREGSASALHFILSHFNLLPVPTERYMPGSQWTEERPLRKESTVH